MAEIKELPYLKPESPPGIIEFIRELLITAYNEKLSGIMYVAWGESGREAHGAFEENVTIRDLERAVDFLDAYIAEADFQDQFEEEDDDAGE
jgi:hypothetical protein